MNESFANKILKSTGATKLARLEVIQSLWSGYGEIVRYALFNAKVDHVIVKHVKFPVDATHPRGWNTNLSHERKVKSYEVETQWYLNWSGLCSTECRVPDCYLDEDQGNEVLLVLEDLDASGFSVRKTRVSWNHIEQCLKWLANFHATFINREPAGLWEVGTYWHLNTRPEELDVLSDLPLKNAARRIDEVLSACKYKTFVHGDAKLANFCFSDDGKSVAAVDFQYVGGGCGMKDVAYFVGSCLNESDCETYEQDILNYYFNELQIALQKQKFDEFEELKSEWTDMYPVAWADFHRFLKGWSPGHWKLTSYSERVVQEVIRSLEA